MVLPIAPAPIPFPSPLFARTGVSPLYAGAMAAGPAIGASGQPDWLSRLSGGVQNNANALIGLGQGLLSSPTFAGGLAAGGQGWMQGNQTDMALAERKAAQGDKAAQKNYTIEAFKKAGRQDLIDMANAGLTDQAWAQFLKGPDGPIKVGKGDTLVDPNTYQTLYSAPNTPDVQPGMQLNADGTQSPIPNGKEAFDREQALNQQYAQTDPVKTYSIVKNNYQKVREAAKSSTGAGDISMIFAYMKMLDPTSVVREGEFATAQNSGGISATVQNIYNSILSGQRLTPEQRRQFVAEADKIYGSSTQNLASENDLYANRSKPWGVDPTHFLVQPQQFDPLQLNDQGVADPLGIR